MEFEEHALVCFHSQHFHHIVFTAVFGFFRLLKSQRTIAMISEMIHTASLIHDDVIDDAEKRRGRESVQQSWGQRKVKKKRRMLHN